MQKLSYYLFIHKKIPVSFVNLPFFSPFFFPSSPFSSNTLTASLLTGGGFLLNANDRPAPPPCFVIENAISRFFAFVLPNTVLEPPKDAGRSGGSGGGKSADDCREKLFGCGGIISNGSSSSTGKLGEYLKYLRTLN